MPISLGFWEWECPYHCDTAKVGMWHRPYPIYDAPLSRPARCSFAPLQKSLRSQRSYEAVCGIASVPTQELTGIVRT